MEKIHNACLVKFFSNCKEHMDTLENINNYPFYEDFNLMKKLIESTDFTGGIEIDDQDYKFFVVEDKFMIGIDIACDDCDDYKYLFDAYNVYLADEYSRYYEKSQSLTSAWRKIMKNAYPYSTYIEDVKTLLNKERNEFIKQINEGIDKQIESL